MEGAKPPPLFSLFSQTLLISTLRWPFFLIIQRPYNENSGVNAAPPQGPKAGVLSYALGEYMVLMDGMFVKTSERAHLIGNWKF